MRKLWVLCGVGLAAWLLGTLFDIGTLVAQAPPDPPANQTAGSASVARHQVSLLSSRETWLTAAILVFGSIIIFVEYLLVRNRTQDKIEDLSKFFVVTLIIIGTLFLIGAGYSNDSIAPAVGLFGTIAGYLLGRSSERPPGAPPPANNNNEGEEPKPNPNPNPNPNPKPNPNPNPEPPNPNP